MKKILSLLTAVTVMVAALAACGGNSGGSGSGDKGAAAVDTNTVAVGAVVIARDDIPEADIYALVSAIFENKDAI